jgi:hypothetical protein
MASYRGLKRAKAKTQKRPGFLVRRGVRGFRAADLADVPTPPSLLLGGYTPDIIPNTFPDVKGWSPSPHLQGRGKDHWGIAVNKKPLGNTMGRKLLSVLL